MSEAISSVAGKPFSWSRAIVAGFIATAAITVSMALFGMNFTKSLGSMILPNASMTLQYLAGGISHLMVGLFYGVVYAWFFGRVREWNPLLKGAVFGLAIAAVASATMPLMASIMPGGRAANPCNPCAGKASNPCNPCAAKPANPCNPCAAKTPNPCNPCGGGGQNPYSGLVTAINHLVYGLALALVYRTRPAV